MENRSATYPRINCESRYEREGKSRGNYEYIRLRLTFTIVDKEEEEEKYEREYRKLEINREKGV